MKVSVKNLYKKFTEKPIKFKVTAVALAVIVFAVLFLGGCKLFGNPITKIRIVDAANNYIDTNIGPMERSRSMCKNDVKRDIYYIDFTPKGWKRAFRLEFREDGTLTKDCYTVDYMYQGMNDLRRQ